MLPHVKEQIIKPLTLLESDDRTYLYNKDKHKIERWPGKAVAMVADYEAPNEFNVRHALQETIYIASEHDPDAEKYLFFISDKSYRNLRYTLEIISSIDKAEFYGNKFVVIGIGSKIDVDAACKGLDIEGISLTSPDSIGDIIIKKYKGILDVDSTQEKEYGRSDEESESSSC